jgi:hypothetical protein
MINTLSKKFEQDYASLVARIEKIPNEQSKQSLFRLLNSLAEAVSDVEKAHELAIYGNRSLMESVGEKRTRIVSVRKQIEQKLSALNV